MLTILHPLPATTTGRRGKSGKSALTMSQRRRAKARPTPQGLRRGGGLRRLPELLGRVLDPAARRRGLAEARLLTDWRMILGPQLGERCQPVRLSGARGAPGVLTIHVGGASALELQHSEVQVVERINDFFGYPAVARLRLIQAPPARPVKPPARWPVRALASEELAGLAATVEAVSDAGLRSALARLGRTVNAQLADPDRRRPAAG
jgi:hypothetical protein